MRTYINLCVALNKNTANNISWKKKAASKEGSRSTGLVEKLALKKKVLHILKTRINNSLNRASSCERRLKKKNLAKWHVRERTTGSRISPSFAKSRYGRERARKIGLRKTASRRRARAEQFRK